MTRPCLFSVVALSLLMPAARSYAQVAPALVFQGTADEWTSVDLAKRFAAIYRAAGGTVDLQFLEGERHTFVNEHPYTPNSIKAIAMVEAFIKKYGAATTTSQ